MTDLPAPFFEDGTVRLFRGKCEEQLRALPANSVDSVITDPPYGMSNEPDMAKVLKDWLAGSTYEHTGGGFMGRAWDQFVPGPQIWLEIFRVLKPGGMLAAFASTRTADLMGIAIRLAGFERRDTILHIGSEAYEVDVAELAWLYGSGFPKEGDLGIAVDRHLGHDPVAVKRQQVREPTLLDEGGTEVVDATRTSGIGAAYQAASEDGTWVAGAGQQEVQELEPVSEEGKRWRGWSSTLKPANEPIILARKPLGAKNIPANLLKHGVGAYNIAGATVGEAVRSNPPSAFTGASEAPVPVTKDGYAGNMREGRWPANVVVSHAEGCEQLSAQSVKAQGAVTIGPSSRPHQGYTGSGAADAAATGKLVRVAHVSEDGTEQVEVWRCVEGCQVREMDKQGSVEIAAKELRTGGTIGEVGRMLGVTRFFYCPKPTRAEKDAGVTSDPVFVANRAGGSGIAKDEAQRAGLEVPETAKVRNTHVTVKPIALMDWLVRLLCPPGGTVLDPFMGSGTTGCAVVGLEGFSFVGVELEEESARIAQERIVYWAKAAEEARAQLTMF